MLNKLIHFAKDLRKRATDTERFLWKYIRKKQIKGLKFRRQVPIDKYIVDFACFEKRIVIELDGGQHVLQKIKDEKRDKYLSDNGFKVLRFWDNEVFQNIEGVLDVIAKNCE